MTKRKLYRSSTSINNLDGQNIVELLDAFCELYGLRREEVRLEVSYDDDPDAVFCALTTETDEEYQMRLERERRYKEHSRLAMIDQYEKLKKELGYE